MNPAYNELKIQLVTTKAQLANTEAKLCRTEAKLCRTEAKLAEMQSLLQIAVERIKALEERLNKNSDNSSKPPSTDQKGNSRGGNWQRKHRETGFHRLAYTPDQVDHFTTYSLDTCLHCGSKQLDEYGEPLVLQQVDLPKVTAIVNQFTCIKHRCRLCGETSFADLPDGVPHSAFGTRLMALIATLTGAFHLSKRDGMQLIHDLYGIKVSEGSMINIEERVASALKKIDERIHRAVMTGAFAKHFDETSWRDSGKNHYVWIGSTQVASCYRIDPSRSRAAFERFSGPLGSGPIVTDRYAVYSHLTNPHQYCLAHLIRDFRKYAERDGSDAKIGNAIKEELKMICRNHRKFREKEISKRSRNTRFRHQKLRLEHHLVDGLANGSNDLSGLCNRLLDDMHHLWTFSEFTDVEPTNNLAERDLRKIVLWRKKSYGTRSERGKRFVERITGITVTARKAGKNVLTFVTEAVFAFYSGAAPPLISPSLGF